MKALKFFAITIFALTLAAPALRAADDKDKAGGGEPPAAAEEKAAPPAEKAATPENEPEKQADKPEKATDAPEKKAGDAVKADTGKEDTAKGDAKPEKAKSLTIASWGGAYARSQNLAFIKPFGGDSGINVKLVSHEGKFDGLAAGGAAKGAAWDVVDLGSEALESACSAGELERIGVEDLAQAGNEAPSKDDFLPGALQDCGIASVAWSSVIVFDKEAFEGDKPKTAADFFNVEKFPGERALPDNPKYLLPLALMADGVEPGEVYAKLESEEGVAQAFAKLETLRDDIVWWRSGSQPLELLDDKKASMAIAFNGRAFYAVVRDNHPFGIIWEGQIYDLDFWAVPKGAPNRDAALEFIAYALQPERLAAQTGWFPYGPMRKSAVAKIGKHAEVDVAMHDFVPTAEGNFDRALRVDPAWWAKNSGRLAKRFEDWMTASDGKAAAQNSDDDKAGDKDDEAKKADDGKEKQ